ncbi:MAG: hypothetical protein ACTSPI_00870 [Candidatus Heimdallarchaeaceae archaeon]
MKAIIADYKDILKRLEEETKLEIPEQMKSSIKGASISVQLPDWMEKGIKEIAKKLSESEKEVLKVMFGKTLELFLFNLIVVCMPSNSALYLKVQEFEEILMYELTKTLSGLVRFY